MKKWNVKKNKNENVKRNKNENVKRNKNENVKKNEFEFENGRVHKRIRIWEHDKIIEQFTKRITMEE